MRSKTFSRFKLNTPHATFELFSIELFGVYLNKGE